MLSSDVWLPSISLGLGPNLGPSLKLAHAFSWADERRDVFQIARHDSEKAAGESGDSIGQRPQKTAPAFAGRRDRLVLDAVGRLLHPSLGDHIPPGGDVHF